MSDTTETAIDVEYEDVSIPGEEAPPPGAEVAVVEALDPRSGEVIDLRSLELVDVGELLEQADRFIAAASEFRRAIVDEGARRLDRMNARRETVGDLELETNAPSSVQYREDVLKRKLEELVEADVLDASIIDRVFPTPEPPPPPGPKLSKRELNKLKSNERVAAAIAAASVRTASTRTLKVTRKAPAE